MTAALSDSTAAGFFGGWASAYDRRYDARDADGHALRSRLAAAADFAGAGPGTALDAGMGPGRLCERLADAGWIVNGVDAAPEMVDVARRRVRTAATLLRADIEEIPFDGGQFDLVTATGVLEYSDLPRALAEIRRVVRTQGRVVVSYPNPHALYGIWKTRTWYPAIRALKRLLRRPHPDLPRGAGQIAPGDFIEVLRAAGFQVIRSQHTSFLLLPTPVDILLPRAAARLGAMLEGRPGAAARLFATQVVYEARPIVDKQGRQGVGQE